MSGEAVVTFRCVAEGSRLRVRVTTPGYNPYINCQFPKGILLFSFSLSPSLSFSSPLSKPSEKRGVCTGPQLRVFLSLLSPPHTSTEFQTMLFLLAHLPREQ